MANMQDMDITMAKNKGDDAVLPCPFCGSENIAYGKYEHVAGTRFAVVCLNCMAQIDPGWAQNWWSAQELWNHRVESAKIASLTAQLAESQERERAAREEADAMCSRCGDGWFGTPPPCDICAMPQCKERRGTQKEEKG